MPGLSNPQVGGKMFAYKLAGNKGYRIAVSVGSYFLVAFFGSKPVFRTPEVYRRARNGVRIRLQGASGEYQVEVWRSDKRVVYLDGGMARIIKNDLRELDELLMDGDYIELPLDSPIARRLLTTLAQVRFE